MTDTIDLIRQHDEVWKDKSIPMKDRVRKCKELHEIIAAAETNNYTTKTERSAGSESRLSVSGWIALTKNIERRKDEARRLEEQFKDSEA